MSDAHYGHPDFIFTGAAVFNRDDADECSEKIEFLVDDLFSRGCVSVDVGGPMFDAARWTDVILARGERAKR